MMKNNSHIKKNDKVKIIVGKDKGKIGKVMKVIGKKNRIIVENVNMMKNHSKPSAQNKQGGIIEREAPLNWSNTMLICNKCITPVRIRIQQLEDGKKVRVCKKCNELIDA